MGRTSSPKEGTSAPTFLSCFMWDYTGKILSKSTLRKEKNKTLLRKRSKMPSSSHVRRHVPFCVTPTWELILCWRSDSNRLVSKDGNSLSSGHGAYLLCGDVQIWPWAEAAWYCVAESLERWDSSTSLPRHCPILQRFPSFTFSQVPNSQFYFILQSKSFCLSLWRRSGISLLKKWAAEILRLWGPVAV